MKAAKYVRYGAQPCGRRKQSRPRAATKAAAVYDHFIKNEGEPVAVRDLADMLRCTSAEVGGIIERLNNAYDIFIVHQGKGYYILLNEEELV